VEKAKTKRILDKLNPPGRPSFDSAFSPRDHLVGFLVWIVVLLIAYGRFFWALGVHAATSDLNSHILLIPFISLYLLYLQRAELPKELHSSPFWAIPPFALGLAAAGFGIFNDSFSLNDSLATLAFSFVCFVTAGGFLFMGRQWMAARAFPLAFLLFMVPLPDSVTDWLETASKLASVEAADFFFAVTGEPVLRNGTIFQLSSIVLEVAPECSGIRSSWVLFIVAILASHLFLRSPWRRILLIFFVIPLGIIRNGFRIMVIGLLCVHIDPQMINSPIHKKGGPIFFVLSLIPFLLLLWWLHKGDARARTGKEIAP
jgi:exosortase C (VPDSG-CTERM-specific)